MTCVYVVSFFGPPIAFASRCVIQNRRASSTLDRACSARHVAIQHHKHAREKLLWLLCCPLPSIAQYTAEAARVHTAMQFKALCDLRSHTAKNRSAQNPDNTHALTALAKRQRGGMLSTAASSVCAAKQFAVLTEV